MVKKVIVGAYGTGNLGDEAILAGILNILKTIKDFKKSEIIVFSRNPDETIKLHNINSRRRNLLDLLYSDEVLIGGGELFQKQGNMAIKYSLLAFLAKMFGKKLTIHAVGVSSNVSLLGKVLMRLSLNLANEISVRDKESRSRLIEMGVINTINVVQDPAFDVEPISDKNAYFLLKNEDIDFANQKIRIAVILQHLADNELREKIHIAFSGFLKNVLDNNPDAELIFTPFTSHMDKPLDRDFIYGKWLERQLKTDRFKVLKGKFSPQEMMGILGLMDIVVSTRMHPIILAKRMRVSAIGIGLFDKTVSFCKKYDIPLIKVDEISKISNFVNNIIEKKRGKAYS